MTAEPPREEALLRALNAVSRRGRVAKQFTDDLAGRLGARFAQGK